MKLRVNFTKILVPAILLVGLLVSMSCEDYLDKAPNSDIGATEPYENFTNFQGFVEELYNCIPVFTAAYYHNSFNLGDEEHWVQTAVNEFAYDVDRGNFWEWNSYGSPFTNANADDIKENSDAKRKGHLWGFCWYGIRKANLGIANLDNMTDATQEEKDLIAGQLFFFRAWFHFQIMKYWGGIPYIDVVIAPNEPIRLPRLSYQDCADKAAEDFKKAADLLPIDWDDTEAGADTRGNNMQRANKIMALAYMGKNLLFAGSPLMNEVSGGATEYNADYCKRAAEALGEALKLSETTGRYELASFDQYTELFYSENSDRVPGLKETIFWENTISNKARFRWNQVNDYIPRDLSTGGFMIAPTAHYCFFNYGMENGLPINESLDITQADAESGYDPSYPWRGRDPRFYKDFIVDGERCSASDDLPTETRFASLYTGGFYRRPDGGNKVNLTGLMTTKWKPKLAERNTESTTMNNATVLSLMRLADVYLMYGEASAVGNGITGSANSYSSLTAVEAINVVRRRAGVGEVAAKFQTSLDLFLSEVRRERAVELAFEGHRFCDLRRWKLLDKSPYNLKTAIDFERDPDGLKGAALALDYKNAKVLNLSMRTIFERNYTSKHYWFPFLIEDVNIYPEFQQNPGW